MKRFMVLKDTFVGWAAIKVKLDGLEIWPETIRNMRSDARDIALTITGENSPSRLVIHGVYIRKVKIDL